MQNLTNATAGHTGGGDRTPRESSVLIDVQGVAALLNCSVRHVYRLCDLHRMPRPVKLGALARWSKTVIANWIDQGCPSCRNGGQRE
jgi:predicted DNA-binding transcriptional regulator AlpA